MSDRAVSWALKQPIPMNEKMVLVVIADHINSKTGVCWPSQERIAELASCSVRTVRTMIDNLVDRGLLFRERYRSTEAGSRTTDRYRLNRHGGVNRQILPPESTGKSEGGNRQTVAGSKNQKGTGSNNKARARAIPLPDDWKPTDEHRAMAEARGLDVEQQALAFRFHAEANDRHQVRWNPAFSQWLMHARSLPKAYIPRNNTDRGFVPPAPRYPDVQVDDEFEPYFPPPLDAK